MNWPINKQQTNFLDKSWSSSEQLEEWRLLHWVPWTKMMPSFSGSGSIPLDKESALVQTREEDVGVTRRNWRLESWLIKSMLYNVLSLFRKAVLWSGPSLDCASRSCKNPLKRMFSYDARTLHGIAKPLWSRCFFAYNYGIRDCSIEAMGATTGSPCTSIYFQQNVERWETQDMINHL